MTTQYIYIASDDLRFRNKEYKLSLRDAIFYFYCRFLSPYHSKLFPFLEHLQMKPMSF